jgi:hypothetical protein
MQENGDAQGKPPAHHRFPSSFPPSRFLGEGGKEGGWASNHPCGLEHLCYNNNAFI